SYDLHATRRLLAFKLACPRHLRAPQYSPTRRSSDLATIARKRTVPSEAEVSGVSWPLPSMSTASVLPFRSSSKRRSTASIGVSRSEEHTTELQLRFDVVYRLLYVKKKETIALDTK